MHGPDFNGVVQGRAAGLLRDRLDGQAGDIAVELAAAVETPPGRREVLAVTLGLQLVVACAPMPRLNSSSTLCLLKECKTGTTVLHLAHPQFCCLHGHS